MKKYSPFSKKCLAYLFIFCIVSSSSVLNAQVRTSRVAVNKPPASGAGKCSGAWTGSITYTRTQSQTDNKTVPRVSGRGQDTRNWEMRYNYSAHISVVESLARAG